MNTNQSTNASGGIMNTNEDTHDTEDWTVAEVTSFPKCDYCEDAAAYDSKVAGHTAWAWMCETHFQRHGSGLGCGVGQRLVLFTEKGAE